MSNPLEDPLSTELYNSTTSFSNSTFPQPPDSNSTVESPLSTTYHTDVLVAIAANDLTSRANYVYALCAALGLAASCFLLHDFVQTMRAQRRVAWLNYLLWAFCGSQLLLLLLSLSSAAHRPNYLMTTLLACAILSFTVNIASLCGLLLLVLMAYVLTFDPPSHNKLRRPWVCVSLVLLASALCCVLLAGLRGPSQGLGGQDFCVLDPVQAGGPYAVGKLCLGLLIPYVLLLGLLMTGCVRQWKSSGRFLSGSEEGPVFLAVSMVTFVCQLLYSVVLLRGAVLGEAGKPSNWERAILSVAELVLFSGSCICLLLVLLIHRPSRESLQNVLRQLRDCCHSLGGRQTHRHIIAPRIEITDTLEDCEV